MTYEDRVRIETPEGVELELILAGLGSRVGSAAIDAVVRGVAYVVLSFVVGLGVVAFDSPWLSGAVLVPLILLIEVGYDIAFELLARGKTIGKRAMGIAVVRTGGEPVDFRASAVRNLLRPIDVLITFGIAGIVAILATPKNQRLGDLAAGTLVIRDRVARSLDPAMMYHFSAGMPSGGWDVGSVTADELATLRRFLERRAQLDPQARMRIASELASRIRPKVAGAPATIHPEALIEQIVRIKMARG